MTYSVGYERFTGSIDASRSRTRSECPPSEVRDLAPGRASPVAEDGPPPAGDGPAKPRFGPGDDTPSSLGGRSLGFDRVWRFLARLGKEPPHISDGPRFSVAVGRGRGDRTFARFVVGAGFPEPRLSNDLDVLLILSALRRQRLVRAQTVSSLIQRDDGACQRTLERMRAAGILEPTRRTAQHQFPSYRLTPGSIAGMGNALTYRSRSLDSDDIKLGRHLKRHRRISNEDVRSYLDCDVATARNRLTRMRKLGWIDFAPASPRRGPNVEYVALEALEAVELQ
jgi:ATP-dependent DNA helicase RecG